MIAFNFDRSTGTADYSDGETTSTYTVKGERTMFPLPSTDFDGSVEWCGSQVEVTVDENAAVSAAEFLIGGRKLSEIVELVDRYLPSGPVIVKCRHCGQFGARLAACKHCGAPIE